MARVIIGKKKKDYAAIVLYLLRNGPVKTIPYSSYRRTELMDAGIIYKSQGKYMLNLELLKRCSYVISDELYEKLQDEDYVLRLRARLRGEDEEIYIKKRKLQNDWHKRQNAKQIPLRQRKRMEALEEAKNKDPFLNLEDALFSEEEV